MMMDIAALATEMNMAQLSTDIGVAVLDQSLELVQDMGQGMIDVLESTVRPELGQNIDLYV